MQNVFDHTLSIYLAIDAVCYNRIASRLAKTSWCDKLGPEKLCDCLRKAASGPTGGAAAKRVESKRSLECSA